MPHGYMCLWKVGDGNVSDGGEETGMIQKQNLTVWAGDNGYVSVSIYICN